MATSDQVQQLYITYFGRPADPSGLAYWTADEATPVATIADGFSQTPEFEAKIAGRTLDQIVNDQYLNLFGRNAEPDGLAFWVQQIQIGNTTIQQVGLDIGNAAIDSASLTNTDFLALDSKIDASDLWTATTAADVESTLAYSGELGIQAGFNFLLPVLSPATVPDQDQVDADVAALVAENRGGTPSVLNLSVLQDVATNLEGARIDANGSIQEALTFRFSGLNQVVNGTQTTFSGVVAGDRLVDPSTTDNDVLNVTAVTNLNLTALGGINPSQLVVRNIENLNFALQGAVGSFTPNGAQLSGVNNFTATGTIGALAGVNLAGNGATSFDSTAVTGGVFTVTMGNGANTVDTGATLDIITTGNAVDTINSGAGNDVVFSGAGADVIDAGAGADFINGEAGADTITGGAGADQFQFANFATADTIVDFATGTDTLGLSLAAGFTGFLPGGMSATTNALYIAMNMTATIAAGSRLATSQLLTASGIAGITGFGFTGSGFALFRIVGGANANNLLLASVAAGNVVQIRTIASVSSGFAANDILIA